MRITNIKYTTNFVREFKKLTPEKKQQAIKAEKIFKTDPFSPKLRTHKLTGKLSGLWAFWINHGDRIMFEFLGEGKIVFYRVGGHDIYKQV